MTTVHRSILSQKKDVVVAAKQLRRRMPPMWVETDAISRLSRRGLAAEVIGL
jgi:hypothetical protein